MKHTKGPWRIRTWSDGSKGITDGDSKGYRHEIITNIDACGTNLEEQASNAKLIAAAPELLEACESLMQKVIDSSFDISPISGELARISKAVSKATSL